MTPERTDAMNDMQRLAECPFCGDDMSSFAGMVPESFAKGPGSFAVECNCGVFGPFDTTMQGAVLKWNVRAQAQGEPVAWQAIDNDGKPLGDPTAKVSFRDIWLGHGSRVRSLFAAPPAPSDAGMRERADRLKALLDGRDNFIVSKALWTEFVATLPASGEADV